MVQSLVLQLLELQLLFCWLLLHRLVYQALGGSNYLPASAPRYQFKEIICCLCLGGYLKCILRVWIWWSLPLEAEAIMVVANCQRLAT